MQQVSQGVLARARRAVRAGRRGVTGVLSMMFLVMFGSLAVAMAVVSQGNLRTADTHMRVARSIGAVDTGLEIARARLEEAATRVITARGDIDPDYATDLWMGTYGASPAVVIIPPPDGRDEDPVASSIMDILIAHHAWDDADNIVGDIALPTPPPGWVVAPPIGIERNEGGQITTAAQITYVPPDEEGRVLTIVTGYDWDFSRERWVTRTAQRAFQLTKRIEHAVLSPARVMVGRNVQISGPVGAAYVSDALDSQDGPPLVVRSDFMGLDPILDDKLEAFFQACQAADVNGDNRLRVLHKIEGQAVEALNGLDIENPPGPDNAFVDGTRDNIVDEYDIFLRHFGGNDSSIILSAALTDGTPASGGSAEFDLDDALAFMIDSSDPDRNGNSRFNGEFIGGDWDFETFPDNNNDGLLDVLDVDEDDVRLGYRDGVLDWRDPYAKIRGSVKFRVDRADWEASQWQGEQVDDYQKFNEGTILAGRDESPVEFSVDNSELPEITAESFADGTNELRAIADPPSSFASQAGAPSATRAEPVPFGSPSPADWYIRPVYEGVTFKNVTIPMGTNALFIDCTFVGVTRIETYTDNTHPSWNFYGQLVVNPATGQLEQAFPPPPADSDAQLDKSYALPGDIGYDNLPEPLIVDVDLDGDGLGGDQCTDTKRISNNLRFHDCLFVGSIVSDTPVRFNQLRNKATFTGATKFATEHPDEPLNPELNPDSEDLPAIKKSSLMLPNHSVDIGTNNSPPDQDVQLKGAIIAGIIDVRGNATIEGVMLTSYKPTYGVEPLAMYDTPVGNPADFNVTLGYFGPQDGDQEGIDLSQVLANGGILGTDFARDPDGNLIDVSTWDGVNPPAIYDGVPDDPATLPAGDWVSQDVPFNGFGQIVIRWDPDVTLPDGFLAPVTMRAVGNSYAEGKFEVASVTVADEEEN
ncbi:MAG: hypothetical protein AAGD00_01030 [Planctomycetota bacterium]